MADVLINPRNHTGGNNDDFIGMKFASENGAPSVNAFFPLGYHYAGIDNPAESGTKTNQTALRKELYALLGTIKRYSRNDDGRLEGTTAQTDEFPFDAYITIIKSFMQNGYYIESEIKYKNAPTGKINWRRTIAQIKPIIQDNSHPVYTDFIIRQNEKRTDKLISLIHEWCVYEAFTKLGWLFTPYNPHKPALDIRRDDKKEREYYISVIHASLKTTFNDRNKLLFNAMIAMLNHSRADEKNAFFYGTTHFHTVWENLIDISYGIPEVEKKEYFPPAEWIVDNKRKENKLFPDTIMRFNSDEIFVLDAKYYSYVIYEDNLPAASDINKQVTYGAYAHTTKHKKGSQFNKRAPCPAISVTIMFCSPNTGAKVFVKFSNSESWTKARMVPAKPPPCTRYAPFLRTREAR